MFWGRWQGGEGRTVGLHLGNAGQDEGEVDDEHDGGLTGLDDFHVRNRQERLEIVAGNRTPSL